MPSLINYKNILQFLEVVGRLKHIKREGWRLRSVPDPETISGHMYRMAMMTFLLDSNANTGHPPLNRLRCLELTLVHDLAEAIVGDITPCDGIHPNIKQQWEIDAMKDITKLLSPEASKYLMDLFLEYEMRETAESKFVKELDGFDLIFQAFEYEKKLNKPFHLQEFFDSVNGKFDHPLIMGLNNELVEQRQNLKKQNETENTD